jgi:hypothetical protein
MEHMEHALEQEQPRQSPRVSLVDQPGALSPSARSELTAKLVDLSWRATAGAAGESYEVGQRGWEAYYGSVGNRVSDYDRMVLVEQDERLLHAMCVQTLRLGDTTLVWIHIAITDPAYHASGLLGLAAAAMFAPGWLGTLPAPRAAVFRTPNPIAYEAVRALAPRLSARAQVYPQIEASGVLSPTPERVRALCQQVSAQLSPGCEFDPETFVLRGYYKQFGALYSSFDFPCRSPGVAKYFSKALDAKGMDGLVIWVELPT